MKWLGKACGIAIPVQEMDGTYQHLDQLPSHVRDATFRFLDDHCIVAITDIKGVIIYANDAFVRISGYSRDELVGQNHRILKSGRHPPEFYHDMWRTVSRGDVWTGEICNRRRDGDLYWVESTLSPLRDADGRTTHYCALRIDITARKDAQQRLLDAMERDAERRHLESVGRMADGILHDLNNLLGGAIMLTDLGDREPQDVAEQRTFLTRMAQLIRNVRDFSTGRVPEMKVCDAARAIAEACRLASYVVRREREITIEIDVAAAEGLAIRINEAQLLEVVLNLFTNAVEALVDRPEPLIVARVAVDAGSRRLYLTVTDNGPGVPETVAHRLFEPYTSSKGRGRGIGLAAARRLARGLDGDLELRPTIGGACFCLTLPLASGLPASGAVPIAAPDVPRDAGLILLADDDREFLGTLEHGLRESGYRTISATAADDAILLAGQFRDCLTAAVLDSVGTVKECALVGFLRTVKRELPIVLVSGALTRPGIHQTQHGPVHVLPKPFSTADLLALLRPG